MYRFLIRILCIFLIPCLLVGTTPSESFQTIGKRPLCGAATPISQQALALRPISSPVPFLPGLNSAALVFVMAAVLLVSGRMASAQTTPQKRLAGNQVTAILRNSDKAGMLAIVNTPKGWSLLIEAIEDHPNEPQLEKNAVELLENIQSASPELRDPIHETARHLRNIASEQARTKLEELLKRTDVDASPQPTNLTLPRAVVAPDISSPKSPTAIPLVTLPKTVSAESHAPKSVPLASLTTPVHPKKQETEPLNPWPWISRHWVVSVILGLVLGVIGRYIYRYHIKYVIFFGVVGSSLLLAGLLAANSRWSAVQMPPLRAAISSSSLSAA